MKKKLNFLIPVLLLYFLISCDALIEISYYVKNDTDSQHKVYYSVNGTDTVVVVPANFSVLLYKKEKVGKKNRFVMVFSSMYIDSIGGNANEWLMQEKWTMKWKTYNQGVFTLKLDSLCTY